MFKRPCIDCGALSLKSRCETHTKILNAKENAKRNADPVRKARKKQLYNSTYRRRAKQVTQTATVCHICGKGYTPGDPWQADHLYAGEITSPLLPAHRSCNARKGNKTTGNKPPSTTHHA